MINIQVIDNIKLNRKGLFARDNKNRWVLLHRQQGEMGGACAVYCLMMNLLILGYISEEDISIYNKADRRTQRGKFISHFLEDQGFIRSGYSYTALSKEVRIYCEDLHTVRKSPKELDNKIEIIANCIENNSPIIISVVYEGGEAHALLAVGIESDEKDNINKILCLDPSEPSPMFSEWNCFIDVHKDNGKEYPFWYVTEKRSKSVTLDDMILIENK